MAKKPRSQRRKRGGGGVGGGGGGSADGNGGSDNITSKSKGRKNTKNKKSNNNADDDDMAGDVDYLSETHTIATFGSTTTLNSKSAHNNNNNINGTWMDDEDWTFGDDENDNGANARDNGLDTETSAEEVRAQKLLDALSSTCGTSNDDNNDGMYFTEKRSSKRLAILKVWFRALSQYALTENDIVHHFKDSLVRACCHRALNAGSDPAEQYAACRVLEVTATWIADDEYYEQISSSLLKIIQSTHRAVPVRSAALRALGMAIYIGVNDDVITEQMLDTCETLMRPEYRSSSNPCTLRATAIQIWTLLATTIHDLYISGKDDVSIGRGLLLLPLLSECLDPTAKHSSSSDAAHSDSNGIGLLRAAAGECVSYIHTSRMALGIITEDDNDVDDDDNENDDAGNDDNENHNDANNDNDVEEVGGHFYEEATAVKTNTTQRQFGLGSWEGSEWEDVMLEIEMYIQELSNQSGHYMSKKAKKEQRATFREYLSTIQDNEQPIVNISFRGGSIELSTWKDIIALNTLRRCLQGGFQIHALMNTTIQTVLGVSDGSSLRNVNNMSYSQVEKRLLLSKTSEVSKLKDIDRTKKRKTRTNIKNHFLTIDGEEI